MINKSQGAIKFAAKAAAEIDLRLTLEPEVVRSAGCAWHTYHKRKLTLGLSEHELVPAEISCNGALPLRTFALFHQRAENHLFIVVDGVDE